MKIKSLKFYYYKIGYFNRQKGYNDISIKNVLILYYIPESNKEKFNSWIDGFTKGMNILNEDYNLTWINLFNHKPNASVINEYDFVLVKSCWGWIVDRYVRKVKGIKIPRGIIVSCSKEPKSFKWLFHYDVVWYQTHWYKKMLNGHPKLIHAFGVNSKDFYPRNLEKEIDVLGIGALTSYKRFNRLINEKGQVKVVVGDTKMQDSEEIISELKSNGVKVLDYKSQEELALLINRSKLVYLPSEIDGGGERAVLETRMCGVNVKVSDDNPKLQELLKSPIWDENHYGNQIRLGIESFIKPLRRVFETNRICSSKKIKAGRNSFYNTNFEVRGDENVYIGSFCSFGKNISILTSNHDINYACSQGYLYRKYFMKNHPGEEQFPPSKSRTKGDVIIGNDVWIGDNVTILSGVKVGDGASIATGSIVTKNIKPYEIHGGIPNKVLKSRFSQKKIDFMLELQWWNWSDTKIKLNHHFFHININKISLKELSNTIKNS